MFKKHLLVLLSILAAADNWAQKSSVGDHDSITVSIAPEYDQVSRVHRWLFGEGYRKLWAAPVRVKVLHLSKEKGGLKPVEKGGGMQTRSLTLVDKSGKEWVLRSIQKYPEQGLPPHLKETIARDILQDQVVTGHPFAALTVPPFAEALGIPYSSPEVVYVPDDPTLGKFKSDFANSVLLFEEKKPPGTGVNLKTEELQEKKETNNDVKVNQRLLLRARLLDLFMGDWDRHEGQWRWEENKSRGAILYNPIPRDRDKVYYNTSGLFPWLLSHQSTKINLQGFNDNIRDIPRYNFNNRYFDRYFLNELSESEWNEEITFVENKLTDNLIRNAVRRLPEPIYSLSANKIINTLIKRRKFLRNEAMKYYRFLSKNVDIPASDKNEIIEVSNASGGAIAVDIYKAKKNAGKNELIYNRVFQPGVTKEIRLYGLGGSDVFSVGLQEESAIKVRMIGGSGTDSFYVNSAVDNKRKLFVYDLKREHNFIPDKSIVRVRTSGDTSVNEFDRKSFKYNKIGPQLALAINRDQGVLYKAGFIYEKQGFRKMPFAERHNFSLNYATERRTVLFDYSGYFTKLIKGNDLSVDFTSRGLSNVTNFFGIGNETVFENFGEREIDYYRNSYYLYRADILLHRKLSKALNVNGGISSQYYTSAPSKNEDKIFKTINNTYPGEKVFNNRFFTGLTAGFEIETRNKGWFSHKGFVWNAQATGMKELTETKARYGQFTSEINFYIQVLSDSNFVIANRIGGGTTTGNPAFFQQMQLGGINNLRGFHTNRFTGKSMFYYNIDFRAKVFDFTSYLFPGTVGLVVFNDVGRVWVPNEKSDKWHNGYGLGLYIVPAELVLVQALVGNSVEGLYPYISIGFTF